MNFDSPRFNNPKEGNRLSAKLIFGRTVALFLFLPYRIKSDS